MKNKISSFFFKVLITFSGLSPSNTTLSDKGCGKCKDKNAVCALVGNQTTCWCRAGYIKMDNNTCGKYNSIWKKIFF